MPSRRNPVGYCPTCGQQKKLVRAPGATWPAERQWINTHKSPSPVFGPVDKTCPGAYRLPWGAPKPARPEMPGQSSILEEVKK